MKTSKVNISFQTDLLGQIDEVATEESRSRSELIREAARVCIERKKRWKDIFAFADGQPTHIALKEKDVEKRNPGIPKSERTL